MGLLYCYDKTMVCRVISLIFLNKTSDVRTQSNDSLF